MERWVGKVAIVTGASSGIGAAIAELLVKEGLKVAGFARRKEKLEELSKKLSNEKGKLYAVKCDITREDEVVISFKWVKEHLGPIHILINNAGISRPQASLLDGDYKSWRELLDTNVLGLSVATREAVRDMKANNVDGHIIHINSITGHKVLPNVSMYGASKFAVTSLTEALRLELSSNKLKIKITSVSPGLVRSEITESIGLADGKMPILEGEDIAQAIKYILSTPPHVQIHELTIKPVGEQF